MKVKIIITANIKKPKVGDSFGGYGIEGRSGYFESPITKVKKKYIIVDNKKIRLTTYAWDMVINKHCPKKKVKVLICD